MAATAYIVFKEQNEPEPRAWAVVGTYTTATADAAKQAAALEHGDGTYAATPARSWQPTPFKVQPRAVAVKP